MADTREPSFERVADSFLDGYASQVNGYIRYRVIRDNLLETVPELRSPKQLKVIDIGAGDGREALGLSALGHLLTVVDPSPTMVAHLRENADKFDEVLEGDVRVAIDQFGRAAFDGAMMHGVLPYVEQSGQELAELAKLVRPGGFISILNKGYNGTLLRYVNQRRFDEIPGYLKAGNYVVNRLGEEAWARRIDDTKRDFAAASLSIVNWFGVTVITDSIEDKVEDFDPNDLDLLTHLELELSRDPSSKGMGQMVHLVARKN